ncbi:A24 family peptidase [Dyella tabacisoli]|nr:prepilin peptidase [Dyella tabacisoli]
MPAPLPALAVLLCTFVIASDLYSRRVPNVCLLAALLLGTCWMGMSWVRGDAGPPWPALFGLLLGLAVFLPMYAFGWMGAGDVKLFATLGFLLGAKALLPIWIIGSLLAGMHAMAILMSRYWLRQATTAGDGTPTWWTTSPLGRRIASARQGRQGLPYAAYLAIGALMTAFVPALLYWPKP